MSLKPVNTLIEVNRDKRKLKLWKRGLVTTEFKVAKVYEIAVGMAGLETPAGYFTVQAKGKNVDWQMPYSDWVPVADQGTVIPGGDPRNPIKARWIAIADGAGIHGTEDLASLGTAASHGCVRMAIPDVIELFDQVRKGDIVHVV